METISIYDPFLDAYREVSVEIAQKFVEEAKKTEKELKAKK